MQIVGNVKYLHFDFNPRLYVYGEPLFVAYCLASDLTQTKIMVGRQILLKGQKNPGEPSFQERITQL